MAASTEPRNPFYFLLLIVGMLFILTVLAYGVVPVFEEMKATEAGTNPPHSWLRENGWMLVLAEVALLVVLGLASMGLDRWRRWKREKAATTDMETRPPA